MAFLTAVPLLTSHTARSPSVSARRPSAVLDRPASNPHLKEVSASVARDFLTRRAVHTVLYYMREMRDSASVNWLLKFDKFEVREKNDLFHDGEAFLVKMLMQPPVHGEYVQQYGSLKRRYPFTIEPARIANSVLASRKQLAEEWAVDLKCVEAGNLELQRMFIERAFEKDERKLEALRNVVFDVGAFGGNQTPMRHKNISKLLVLVTQHAVARLMPYLRDTSNHDYMWFLEFVSRFGPLSDGDEFVTQLMRQPCTSRTNPTHVVDPKSLAGQILDLRAVVAAEWISVMQDVPDEQLALSRNILERSMKL